MQTPVMRNKLFLNAQANGPLSPGTVASNRQLMREQALADLRISRGLGAAGSSERSTRLTPAI
jgi:hypothetical protein